MIFLMNSPQPSKERTPWRVLEGLRHLCFESPVRRPPNLHRPVVRLSRQEFADRVPAYALNEALVLIKPVQAL